MTLSFKSVGFMLSVVAFSSTISTAQIVTHPNGKIELPNLQSSDGPLGFGSLLWFSSGSNNTAIQENWGLNLSGDGNRPVKLHNASLLVGYQSSGQDFGNNNALISGWLGVGTSAPKSAMHILSNATSKNSFGQFNGNVIIQGESTSRNNSNGATLEFVINADVNGNNPWGQARIVTVAGNDNNHDATGKMILGTRRMYDKQVGTGMTWNYGDDIVIDGEGRVGIGTLSPREALSVNGTIRSKEIKVESGNWPDYVFKANYDLRPLSEVQAFIKKNSHLPGIPSEKQLQKDGVELGEMNRLLLRKVEELTLYIIKEKEVNQKQIALLRKELNSLKNRKK